MPIKIKTQRDYFLTEVTVDLPSNPSELDALMKSMKATGKVVAVYNQGGTLGINIEQRTKVPESVAQQIRELLNISTKELAVGSK